MLSDSGLKKSDVAKPEERRTEHFCGLGWSEQGLRLAAMGDIISESTKSIESPANMIGEMRNTTPLRHEREEHV